MSLYPSAMLQEELCDSLCYDFILLKFAFFYRFRFIFVQILNFGTLKSTPILYAWVRYRNQIQASYSLNIFI